MKKSVNITLSVLGYIIFFALWCVISVTGYFLFVLDYNNLLPKIMKIIYVLLAIGAVISPLYLKTTHPKRAYMSIIVTISFVIIIILMSLGCRGYYSVFSHQKWLNNRYHRYLMVDSLERKYTLKGMTNYEVVELLGEPDVKGDTAYEYVVGDNVIDPIIYRVTFENGIVIHTSCFEA